MIPLPCRAFSRALAGHSRAGMKPLELATPPPCQGILNPSETSTSEHDAARVTVTYRLGRASTPKTPETIALSHILPEWIMTDRGIDVSEYESGSPPASAPPQKTAGVDRAQLCAYCGSIDHGSYECWWCPSPDTEDPRRSPCRLRKSPEHSQIK